MARVLARVFSEEGVQSNPLVLTVVLELLLECNGTALEFP